MPDTITPPAALAIAWVLAAVAAFLVHRNATTRAERFGAPPGGLRPWLWAVLVFLLGVLGLLFYGVAVLGQDRQDRQDR